MANKDLISDELLAAYLDGNTSEEETKQVLQVLKKDKQLQEVLGVALQVEDAIDLAASPSEEVSAKVQNMRTDFGHHPERQQR